MKLDIQKFATITGTIGLNWNSVSPTAYLGSYLIQYLRGSISWSYDTTTEKITISVTLVNNGSTAITQCAITGGQIQFATDSGSGVVSCNPTTIGTWSAGRSYSNICTFSAAPVLKSGTFPFKMVLSIRGMISSTAGVQTVQISSSQYTPRIFIPIKLNNNTLTKINFNGTNISHVYLNNTQIY